MKRRDFLGALGALVPAAVLANVRPHDPAPPPPEEIELPPIEEPSPDPFEWRGYTSKMTSLFPPGAVVRITEVYPDGRFDVVWEAE